MPESLTQPNNAQNLSQVAGMKSECRPASNRNGGRLHLGIPGRLQSESAVKGPSTLDGATEDYAEFRRLSMSAAHPSSTSLLRHLVKNPETGDFEV
ncbi:hypothetical protein, partial [Acidiphilium sp.]|uniref:hypothetical protein n=1 Tax=Acidiphilium sp. TaxID=527 RepID=UPI002589033C